MVDEEDNKVFDDGVEGLVVPEETLNQDDTVLEPDEDKVKKTLDEPYEGRYKKYSLNLIEVSDKNTYKTVIEANPLLHLGAVSSEGKIIKGSKLEIIAKSSNFDGAGIMIINVLGNSLNKSYSFGKEYNNPKKLKKAYLNLIEKIKRKHIVNKSLHLSLYPND